MPQGMPRGHVTRAIRHTKESGVLRSQVLYAKGRGMWYGMKGTYEEPSGILECLHDPFMEAQ
jgi:hypothetical protein